MDNVRTTYVICQLKSPMKSHSRVIRTSSACRLHVVCTSSAARFQPQNISSQRAENSSAKNEIFFFCQQEILIICTDVKKARILRADFCACNDLFVARFKYSEYLVLSYAFVGFVNTILSWPALIPLSRLTYAAYLVHPVVLSYYAFTLEDRMFISDVTYVSQP